MISRTVVRPEGAAESSRGWSAATPPEARLTLARPSRAAEAPPPLRGGARVLPRPGVSLRLPPATLRCPFRADGPWLPGVARNPDAHPHKRDPGLAGYYP